MNTRSLRARIAALKAKATKGQKQLIDLILKLVDGKPGKEIYKTLARLLRIDENRPVAGKVLDLMCRFAITLGEHEAISQILHYLIG